MNDPLPMKASLLCLLALSLVPFGKAFAQSPRGKSNQALPIQGRNLPDVTAYDAEGKPFALHQKLKGRHAVIVFGCLT